MTHTRKLWVVIEGQDQKGPYSLYAPADGTPRGSRVLADEITGMTRTAAVRTLKSMYDSVYTRENGSFIICRK